jgi:hypothetical protein
MLIETILRGLTYEPCLVYLADVIVISLKFQEHLSNLQKKSVPAVPKSPHKTQYREVPTLSEGSTVPRTYCVTRGDNHRPQETESRTGMAKLKGKT